MNEDTVDQTVGWSHWTGVEWDIYSTNTLEKRRDLSNAKLQLNIDEIIRIGLYNDLRVWICQLEASQNESKASRKKEMTKSGNQRIWKQGNSKENPWRNSMKLINFQ